MEFKRQPYDHQLKGLDLSKDKPNYALFMEQGTGKTKVTLDTVNYLYNKGTIDTLIVVAWPNGVHRNWVDNELAKDLTVPYLATFWQSNLTKTKQNQINDVFNHKDGLRVMTYNIEAVNTDKCQKNINQFLESGKVMFVIDQSACIKNPSAARTKTLIKMSTHKNIIYKRILDGDPVAEGLHEYYTQFKFLDPDIIGLRSYTAFRSTYCTIRYLDRPINGGRHIRQVPIITGYQNQEKLFEKIQTFMYRCLADECLDLPDRVYKRWGFSLNPQERRLYDEMKTFNFALIEDEGQDIISQAQLALVKNMRLQQITSGWFSYEKIDQTKDLIEKKLMPISDKSSRYLAFKELIKIAQGKILIFARFVADIKALEKLLGNEAVSYHGGVSEDEKAESKRLFMEDPKVRFFIGQPSTAGIGHTLTSAKHIVFYSNSHSLRLRKECEKRVHRAGLKHKVIIWDLVAHDTQDTKIIQCLIDKKKVADEIMKDPVNFFMEET